MSQPEPGQVDVCVVGSGAGGGVLARELAERGVSVVVLEVGDRVDRSRLPTTRTDWELHRRDMFPVDLRRDRVTLSRDSEPFRISRFKGVGGSTMHYEGLSTRMHPADWRRKSRDGVGADWPLEYQEIVPLYDRVEETLGLSGALDNPFEPPRRPYPNPPVPFSCAVQAIKKGCDRLGLHVAHAPLAILTTPREDRAPCNHCGGCWSGCAMGAISNMGQTYIPLAERAGAEIRVGCMVARVAVEEDGRRATGVEYFDDRGNLHFQRARVVALCGNAVETARLLLLSDSNRHPEGLANSSGQVGRNFMGHTMVKGWALLDARVDGYKGPNINGMAQDYWESDASRGFVGGYTIVLRNGEGGPLSFFEQWVQQQGLVGPDLMDYLERWFGHSVNISAYGEQLPHPDNRVTLDPQVKDSYGLPVPRIRTVLHENEKRMQKHAEGILRDVLEAAGGQHVEIRSFSHILGTHLLGTCRMGADPESSVTDSYGRTHDVGNLFIADGSLFPTSTPANPTLTIQALATRIAGHIRGLLVGGEV